MDANKGSTMREDAGTREEALDAGGEQKPVSSEQLLGGETYSTKASNERCTTSSGKTLSFFAVDDKTKKDKDIKDSAISLSSAVDDNASNEIIDLVESIQPLPTRTAVPTREAEPGAYAIQTIRQTQPLTDAPLINQAPADPSSSAPLWHLQQHLAEAQPVEHHTDTGSLPLAEEYRQDKQSMAARQPYCLWVAASFALLLVAIILPVTLLSKQHNDQGHHLRHTPQPALSLEDRILSLLPKQTIQEIQRNATTPQRQAFQWLLGDPFAHTYSSKRILQRFALACFYHSTDGPRWTYNRNWLEYSRHECTWFSHDGTGNTTAPQSACHQDDATSDPTEAGFARLWLNGNQLRGTIPPQLALVSSLTSLSVHFNQLEWTIPSSLGALTNLDKLGAIGNSLQGTLPTQLGLLTKLAALALLQNHLTGTVPSQLGLLSSNLEWLYLDNNQLQGTLPLQLFQMSCLTNFYFYNNLLTGQLPTEVGLLSHVEHLSLDFNLLEGTLPSELGLLSHVEHLALGHNAMTGTLPTTLGLLSNGSFSDMKLASNLFTGPIPSQLGLVGESFKYMMLAHNEIAGALPVELAGLGNLTWLSVNHNSISGSLPTELASLRHLTLLSVESNNLSGTIPEEVSRMAQGGSLVSMNISDNPMLWGSIPEGICFIGRNITSSDHHGYPIQTYGLSFDCGNANNTGLCGCQCPCH